MTTNNITQLCDASGDQYANSTVCELDSCGIITRNQSDQLHRTDGPAVTYPGGDREWWVDGYLHRTDGPAVIYASGYQEWWWHGTKHRTDGPAVIYASGYQEWYFNGQLHRTDGPAVDSNSGYKSWWWHGKEYDQITHWLIANSEHAIPKQP